MNQEKHLTVKDWAKEDQPREKLMALGKKSLSNAELIAILLGSGVAGMSSVELSKQLLADADNNLTKLSRLDISNLKKYKGIGEAKAVSVIAALELGYRMIGENTEIKSQKVESPEDLFNHIARFLIDLTNEEFWVIYLNNKHKILGEKRVSSGGWSSTPVDLKPIFKGALDLNATTIAVAHNHPSGSVMPSREDKLLTEKIIKACDAIGLRLMDHLIVGVRTDNATRNSQNWFSFAQHGLI